jgi:hypothetical protein
MFGPAGVPNEVRIVITNYIKPQDSVTLLFDKQERRLLGVNISSYLEDPSDAVKLSVTIQQITRRTESRFEHGYRRSTQETVDCRYQHELPKVIKRHRPLRPPMLHVRMLNLAAGQSLSSPSSRFSPASDLEQRESFCDQAPYGRFVCRSPRAERRTQILQIRSAGRRLRNTMEKATKASGQAISGAFNC